MKLALERLRSIFFVNYRRINTSLVPLENLRCPERKILNQKVLKGCNGPIDMLKTNHDAKQMKSGFLVAQTNTTMSRSSFITSKLFEKIECN